MSTKIRALAAAAFLFFYASLASAGVTTAAIDAILIYEAGDLVYVYPIGGVQNAPACPGLNGSYYSFSMTRSRAKEYLAGLLAAQARGATVTFWGTGSCTDQTISETLSYFRIED